MAGRYKAYPEYKDSGIDWLGEIPESWIALPIKRVSSFTTGMTPSTAVSEYYADDETDYEWIRPEDIKETSESVSASKFLTNLGWKTQRVVPAQSSLICCIGTIGKTGYSLKPVTTNQQITAATFNLSPKYYFYVLLAARAELEQMATGNVVQILNTERLGRLYVPFITENEALKIANFLDHETAKIDTLIAKQEKLIELLKEKRQAVISHAVTKGLNPDAPMKDSGVEWLGEVPEHWAVLPTKRFFRLVAEPSPKNHDKELLSVYAAIGVAPRKELEQKGNKASNTDGYWLVKKGDIIVNKLLAWMGAVGYSEYNGVTSPAYDILRKTKDINPKFYHYLFRQEFTQKEFKRWSRGIMEMRLRLYFEELGRIMMPMPPKNEQDAIVDEIESMVSKFSQVEEKSKLQIELLKERKTALISAAVTGKIDVRDWEPK
ncbi:restriction endonuclease subunit S [Vibrio parahaemolyticus]|uniref:Restriction endonuclease subunit S n=1 Tax=Vibrio parahaemolyticus TaxID=670 RepID=A0AA46UHU5_VIBPH|nr:restriction endonuclease subunit S [Vibrio parahaemolyticus]MCC3846491.1 restriction endonuclease subunit S [Vibrio parahaemolyticus]UYV25860.1 restriction endonuclease subunit S [Vibrio parahaemolyticus]HCJ4873293.1 restriction endonuclease subunit S [Vibrio parahaemolyticus]